MIENSLAARMGLIGCILALAGAAPEPPTVAAPAPGTMAATPDSGEFVGRAETNLLLAGKVLRMAGVDIPWLALRTPQNAAPVAPDAFEVADVLQTATVMGSGFVRALSMGVTVGCPDCLVPAPGQINRDALRRMDHILKLAHDEGIKLIIPVIGGAACGPSASTAGGGAPDPVRGAGCALTRQLGRPDGSFYTDPAARAELVRVLGVVLRHVNPETSITWKDDPTILAWENCARCAAGAAPADAAAIGAWTEALGEALKAVDTHHLYENGAFAGQVETTPASSLAPPSVDIIGDRVVPAAGGKPDPFTAAQAAAAQAGRVYIIDEYGWAPSSWTSTEAFGAFLDRVWDNRGVAAAYAQSLSGHAVGGGYLPPEDADPVLYFPGTGTSQLDAPTMRERARMVRRLSYHMLDFYPPTFDMLHGSDTVVATHGRITWRGTAGALAYSISRSHNLTQTGSWQLVCDACVTDEHPVWVDPDASDAPSWYRVTPINANGHAGVPSPPVRNK